MVPRKPKKPPWNAGKTLLPSLEDPSYQHVPEPLPGKVHVGHSTSNFSVASERWNVVEVLHDGSEVLHMAGDHTWVGSESRAETEAAWLSRSTGRRFKAAPARTEKS